MKSIINDIKTGQLKRFYLLYGPERYLVRQYRDRLTAALSDKDDTMNVTRFEGPDISQGEVIDLAETLPFFAERRLILIEDSGLFKKGAGELADYLEAAPDTTYFVFVEQEADRKTKLYKEVRKRGSAVEFVRQTDETLARWVEGRIRKNGKKITKEAYRLFADRTGSDMENIDKELEKLLCYTLDRDYIDVSDVRAVTVEQLENKIFDMVDAVAVHDSGRAFKLYESLLALREPALKILYLISTQMNRLMTVAAMTNQGFGNRDIAAKAGCPEWAVRKYQAQSRAFSVERLKQALREGAQLEEAAKTGRMDERIAVELFITRCSRMPGKEGKS